MSKIKYYALSGDEKLPDEFCAIRNINGEPEEYVFYVRDSEVAELRTLCEDMLDYSRGAGLDNMAEWFRDRIDALGLVV